MAKILIIEDDYVLANEWTDVLESNGHNIHAVPTASDGKVLLSTNHYDAFVFDLYYRVQGHIVPDGGMRLIGSVNRAKLTRESKYHNVPIIAVTAHRAIDKDLSPSYIARVLGATHFLQKPFPPDELLALINSVLASKAS